MAAIVQPPDGRSAGEFIREPPDIAERRSPTRRVSAVVPAPAGSETGAPSTVPEHMSLSRCELAHQRLPLALAALAECHLCEHRCGVNRLAGERGLCKAGTHARVFSAQVEVADELELIPTFAIALSGCDLRCAFCITGEASWNPRAGEEFSPEELAAEASAALSNGARTVMILGGEPTIHLPTVLEIVAALPDDAKLVWKTNAHPTGEARALLDGLFDVWLADFKFGNDDCARRIARVPDYTRIVQENLRWMAGGQESEARSQKSEVGIQNSKLKTQNSELIVRHLLLPGHVECCWRPIAAWLAEELPGVKVSLRTEYFPAWQASRHVEMRGTLSEVERRHARTIACEHGLNLVT
jgi:putative pyruvate formate lyase activating enzyme